MHARVCAVTQKCEVNVNEEEGLNEIGLSDS